MAQSQKRCLVTQIPVRKKGKANAPIKDRGRVVFMAKLAAQDHRNGQTSAGT